MSDGTRRRWPIAILLCGLLAPRGVAGGQDRPGGTTTSRGASQSELDFLLAATHTFTLDMKRVTLRQAYQGLSRRTGITILYAGSFNEVARHDIKFTSLTLKEILRRLGQMFDVSYRIDGPSTLTVIGRGSR